MKNLALLLLTYLSVFATAASAQSCHPPGSFYRTAAIRGNVTMVPDSSEYCAIVAALDASNSPSASAFAWYERPRPAIVWRISFRVDTSLFGQPSDFSYADILSATTHQPYPLDNGTVSLLRAGIETVSSEGPMLVFSAACSDSTTNFACFQAASGFVSGDLIRLELRVGVGNLGYMRWWINAGFDDLPSGTLDYLDNSAWTGVDAVALGVFNPLGEIENAGTQLKIYAIESTDDFIFWSGFSY